MAKETTTLIYTKAAATGGVVTRVQLIEAGVSGSSIDRHIRSGSLDLVCRGVYVAPLLENPLTPLFRAQVAVRGSILSHTTAALLHGFAVDAELGVHVTVPFSRVHRVAGVRVHQTRHFDPDDAVEVRPGLLATSPGRTIIDLAPSLTERRLRHLLQQGFADNKPRPQEMIDLAEKLGTPGRQGVAKVKRCLQALVDEPVTGSELEARLWDGLLERGITCFAPQFKPPWFDGVRGVVDFADPVSKTIIEGDGRRWHNSEAAMTEDRRRDQVAAANGWLVVRVSWDDLVRYPSVTFSRIKSAVESRAHGVA